MNIGMEFLVFVPLLGALFAGAVSGRAGFGAALLLLPWLAHAFGISQSVPLLTLALLTANVPRAISGLPLIQWRRLPAVLAGALPAAAAGALLFAFLPQKLLAVAFGLLLALMAGRSLKRSPAPNLAEGRQTFARITAGLLSGLAGSAGPLGAGPLPRAAAATCVAAATAVHGLKWGVYQLAIPPEPAFHALAIAMGVALIAGAWVGGYLAGQFPIRYARQLLALLFALAALHMFTVAARLF